MKVSSTSLSTYETLSLTNCIEQESRAASTRRRKEKPPARRSHHQLRLDDERSRCDCALSSIDSSSDFRFVGWTVIGTADYGNGETEDGAWFAERWIEQFACSCAVA